MLVLYGECAELADGQRILELGYGWDSLTLRMAKRFPNARITGVEWLVAHYRFSKQP